MNADATSVYVSAAATEWMPHLYGLGYVVGQHAGNVGKAQTQIWQNLPLEHSVSFYYDGLVAQLQSLPFLYAAWWWDLVQTNPLHVLVETTLILSILYILLSRSTDWRTSKTNKHNRNNNEGLTAAEEEELLRDWKYTGRAPLTPAASSESSVMNSNSSSNSNNSWLPPMAGPSVIVHKVDGAKLVIQVQENNSNNNSSSKVSLPKDAGDSNNNINNNNNAAPTLRTVLNLATHDYLGLSRHKAVQQAATEALLRYGCGSCGPRGFYGTMDVHLQLEATAADWLRTEGAILYSDGASCLSSTIASFAKRGDLIVVDEGCAEAIQTGVSLSRAHVKYFAHNDVQDLERVLQSIQVNDAKVGRKPNAQRRFLIVEAVYQSSGRICPLKEVVRLKHEYSYRLVLDETNALGVLGTTGRGLTEACGLERMRDVEITCWALEHAAGSVGGLTQGTDQVVEHQRLSGAGYCFSASSPPFTAVAAAQAIRVLQTAPGQALRTKLTANIASVHKQLQTLCHERLEDVLLVTSDAQSPIQVLQIADLPETEGLDEAAFFAAVVHEGWHRGVAWAWHAGAIALRWVVTAPLAEADISHALRILEESVHVVLGQWQEEDAAA
jgi:serine palmitoyltransferase